MPHAPQLLRLVVGPETPDPTQGSLSTLGSPGSNSKLTLRVSASPGGLSALLSGDPLKSHRVEKEVNPH